MKSRYRDSVRNTAAAVLGVLFLVFLTIVPAQASTYGDFVGFLESLEAETYPVTVEQMGFPASTTDMRDAEGLVNCLEGAGNDAEVAECIDQFSDSELGKQIEAEGEVPSEVDMLIDCYILYRAHDYWGLAWKLSNVAACVVVRVLLAGGFDVCGLLEDLLDLATDIYDYAKAIIEWLGDAGEFAVNALKDAGCFLGIGGCDDKPSIPPDIVLGQKLHPYLSDGLDEREKVSPQAYYLFLNNLKKQVLDSMNQTVQDINENIPLGLTLPLYTEAQMNKAAARFTDGVNVAWTNDIEQREIERRHNLMNIYFGISSKIKELADMVISQCAANSSCSALNIISQRCEHQFSYDQGFAFRHIDRWRTATDLNVANIGDLQETVPSNRQVCEANYGLKKKEFIAVVSDYLQEQNLCEDNDGSFQCSGIDGYTQCTNIMHAFGKDGVCHSNSKDLAAEAKLKIMARFREMGSNFYSLKNGLHKTLKISEKIGPKNLIFTAQPFPCYRPTHNYFFNQIYDELYGNFPDQLLIAENHYSAQYEEQVASVKNTINQLRQNPELATCPFTISPFDPLVVETSYCINEIQSAGLAPGFAFMASPPKLKIDGQDKPVLFFDLSSVLESHLKNPPKLVSSEKDLVGPIIIDPVTELQNKESLRGKDTVGSIQKGDSGVKMQQLGGLQKKITGSVATPQGSKVMSGSLPEGSELPGSPGSSIQLRQMKQIPPKLEIMPFRRANRVGRPVEIKLKNGTPNQVDFILEYRAAMGPFKPLSNPAKKIRQMGELTMLSLDLNQPGQYRIRFRQNNIAPWGAWHNFKVTGNSRLAPQSNTGKRMINPQPEPPGKPQINLKPQ